MTVQEILALVNAGFTAEQVTALAGAMQPEPSTPPTAAETPAQEPRARQEAAQPTAAAIDFTPIVEKLDALSVQLRAQAIRHDEQPAVQSVDEILASIIRPPAAK